MFCSPVEIPRLVCYHGLCKQTLFWFRNKVSNHVRPSFLLVRHPKVLDRLHEEIKHVIGHDDEMTSAHIQRMGYLRCILNESMTLERLTRDLC